MNLEGIDPKQLISFFDDLINNPGKLKEIGRIPEPLMSFYEDYLVKLNSNELGKKLYAEKVSKYADLIRANQSPELKEFSKERLEPVNKFIEEYKKGNVDVDAFIQSEIVEYSKPQNQPNVTPAVAPATTTNVVAPGTTPAVVAPVTTPAAVSQPVVAPANQPAAVKPAGPPRVFDRLNIPNIQLTGFTENMVPKADTPLPSTEMTPERAAQLKYKLLPTSPLFDPNISPEELAAFRKYIIEKEPENFSQFGPSIDLYQRSTMEYQRNRKMQEMQMGQISAEANRNLTGAGAESILRATDIGTGIGQVTNANRSLRQLVRPTMPGMQDRSGQVINQMVDRANFRSMNPASAGELQALRGQINDAYAMDINQSRIGSGGQAGAYGALAQGAVNRRYRNLQSMPNYIAQQRQQADQALAQAASLSASRDQTVNTQNLQRYDLLNKNYYTDANAAGQLGVAGRMNIRRGMGGLAATLPAIQKYRDIANVYSGSYDQMVTKSLLDQFAAMQQAKK